MKVESTKVLHFAVEPDATAKDSVHSQHDACTDAISSDE